MAARGEKGLSDFACEFLRRSPPKVAPGKCLVEMRRRCLGRIGSDGLFQQGKVVKEKSYLKPNSNRPHEGQQANNRTAAAPLGSPPGNPRPESEPKSVTSKGNKLHGEPPKMRQLEIKGQTASALRLLIGHTRVRIERE